MVALAGLGAAGLAQTPAPRNDQHAQAQFAGGFHPQACRYPSEARAAQLSGCCEMNIEIATNGSVVKADGTCSDPIFLEPTRRCLSVQMFVPATRNGRPVQALQHLQYEWRATAPSKESACARLKTS